MVAEADVVVHIGDEDDDCHKGVGDSGPSATNTSGMDWHSSTFDNESSQTIDE